MEAPEQTNANRTSETNGVNPNNGSMHGQIAFLVVLITVGGAFIFHALTRETPLPEPKRDVGAEVRKYLEEQDFQPLSGKLEEVLADGSVNLVPTQKHPMVGKQAPDFTLRDHRLTPWHLKDHVGKEPIVLVFYYGYHCDHCVGQLFAINKDLEFFKELGATVVAISADPPSMTKERFNEYGKFDFPVLSDPENKIAAEYGVYTENEKYGMVLYHGTFVIDRTGKIIWANMGDQPFINNRTLLKELARETSN